MGGGGDDQPPAASSVAAPDDAWKLRICTGSCDVATDKVLTEEPYCGHAAAARSGATPTGKTHRLDSARTRDAGSGRVHVRTHSISTIGGLSEGEAKGLWFLSARGAPDCCETENAAYEANGSLNVEAGLSPNTSLEWMEAVCSSAEDNGESGLCKWTASSNLSENGCTAARQRGWSQELDPGMDASSLFLEGGHATSDLALDHVDILSTHVEECLG